MDNFTTDSLVLMQGSFTILKQNWPIFSVLLINQISFSILVGWLLSGTISDKDTLTSLSFLGGMLGLTIFCLALTHLKIKPDPILFVPFPIFCIVVLGWRWRRIGTVFSLNWVLLTFFFIFILSLRLIFIHNLLVPPYADSVQHLKIVQDMLSPQQPAQAFYQLSLTPNRYYHFGFHALAAWLSGVTTASPIQTILILGQYFQALAIFGLYPLARIVFNNSLSAWLVMLIGLFLPLPSFASNWGKYPAIASLVGIIYGLTLLFIYFKTISATRKLSKKFYWMFPIFVLASLFLHTRSILIFLLAIVLGFVFHHKRTRQFIRKFVNENEYDTETKMMVAVGLSVSVTIVVWELGLPFHSLFGVLLIGVLLLSFYADFNLTLYFSFFILSVCALSLVKISFFGHFLSLMDRPYIAIFLCIPLGFLTAIGLNKLIYINNQTIWKKVGFSLLFVSGIFVTLLVQNHQPSSCCIFVNDDDIFSFEWIRQNIPTDAILGIAATGEPGNFLPTDGGAWIETMTGVPTRKLDFNTDFLLASHSLCKNGVEYIYVDGLDNSFDPYPLVESGAKHLLGFETVSIYQLNCD